MTRKLTVRQQARIELIEATFWYEHRRRGLGTNFVETFNSTLARIIDNPLQFQVVDDAIRRAPLGRYPFGLLYSVSDEDIVILSCFHGRRNPARWKNRR